ncbi:aspartate aminotransferase family protein [Streptomyces sp. NBC_01803]|uniref:aspartate aminotransferase family protein n=1 Tax=Streptomyces sp. NBC_01803 TaxID=2975946 RepID=UPI002DDABB75|nr:aspartate aminotransferase family protein [Streptomyces sp. NBC_01803]WSA45983.1 aspartate aminotransferase family protein [Streptomyces sp. NBC_01803]
MQPAQPMVNAFDASLLPSLPARAQRQISRRDQLLGPGYRLFYRSPVETVRGAGTLLFDEAGQDYLDAYNNVASVGHCHPRVVDAVHQQMSTLNTNTRYIQESILTYSEDLLGTLPGELGHVMYTCTGSEANDLATRVARHYTGNRGVIVTSNAYHGLTAEVASFSPSLGTGVPVGADVRTIRPPDSLRHGSGAGLGAYLREQVRAAIDDLRRHGVGLAAFIADSIFSSDGVYSHPRGFLQPILEEVRAAGGLYIADEVQAGFHRTGEAWWGFQRHGIIPDIMTTGKPMGNGIPVAAAVFRPELIEAFGRDIRYFNTFGGNSVAIAAAQAVLDVIRDERLGDNAREVGDYLLAELTRVTAPYPQVAEVRGAGLFIGVELVSDPARNTPDGAAALGIVNGLRERRVLISASGPRGSVLKLRPPLVFSRADADRLLEALEAVMKQVLR